MADTYRDEYLAALKKLDQASAVLDAILHTVKTGAGLLESHRKHAAILGTPVTFPFPAAHNPSWIVADWPPAERIAPALKDWQVIQGQCENLWLQMGTEQKMGLNPPPEFGT
jgi:hypothetical protein